MNCLFSVRKLWQCFACAALRCVIPKYGEQNRDYRHKRCHYAKHPLFYPIMPHEISSYYIPLLYSSFYPSAQLPIQCASAVSRSICKTAILQNSCLLLFALLSHHCCSAKHASTISIILSTSAFETISGGINRIIFVPALISKSPFSIAL